MTTPFYSRATIVGMQLKKELACLDRLEQLLFGDDAPTESARFTLHRKRRVRKRASVRLSRRFWKWAKRNDPEGEAEAIARGWRELGHEEFADREAARARARATGRPGEFFW